MSVSSITMLIASLSMIKVKGNLFQVQDRTGELKIIDSHRLYEISIRLIKFLYSLDFQNYI